MKGHTMSTSSAVRRALSATVLTAAIALCWGGAVRAADAAPAGHIWVNGVVNDLRGDGSIVAPYDYWIAVSGPYGVAPDGTAYGISAFNPNAIAVWPPYVGSPGSPYPSRFFTFAPFTGVSAVAADAAGYAYVATWDPAHARGGRIEVFAPGASGGVAPVATMRLPSRDSFAFSLALDGAGSLHAAITTLQHPRHGVIETWSTPTTTPTLQGTLNAHGSIAIAGTAVFVSSSGSNGRSVYVYALGATGNDPPQYAITVPHANFDCKLADVAVYNGRLYVAACGRDLLVLNASRAGIQKPLFHYDGLSGSVQTSS
jgi:hypothetical protein